MTKRAAAKKGAKKRAKPGAAKRGAAKRGAAKRGAAKRGAAKRGAKATARKSIERKSTTRTSGARTTGARTTGARTAGRAATKRSAAKGTGATKVGATKVGAAKAGASPVVRQLETLERGAAEGALRLTGRLSLDVTSLDKVFFPKTGHTKGDVMRYYALVAPVLLPLVKDRPLVLKRFPNGVGGFSFFQQKAPDEVPPGVRVETIVNDQGEEQSRFVGGDLATILYGVQLGNISVDPWHSRVQSLDHADYMILDLDPGPGASFQRVVDVARWIRDELELLGLSGVAKTSGSTGIHVYVPLPARTTDETSRDLAEVIATRVSRAHPREATVERAVKSRARGTVYVDWLQNVKAKTVAAPYALRAKPHATVSTPLRWDELDDRLDLFDFTIDTVPERLARLGDIWGPAMKRRNSFDRALEALRSRSGRR